MKKAYGGEVLFDETLNLDRPIADMWEEATPYSHLSPRKDMRYHKQNDLLLRLHEETDFVVDRASIVSSIEAGGRHLHKLRQLGMCVVSFATELREGLTLEKSTEETIIALSASRYVTHCRPMNGARATTYVARPKIEEFILDPLRNYMTWCKTSREPYMLADIYHPNQYGWQETSGIIFLYDIDPLVVDATNDEIWDYVTEDIKAFSDR